MAEIAAVQLISTPDIDENFAQVEALLPRPSETARLVVLPECFASFGGSDKALLQHAQHDVSQIIERLQALAASKKCWIIAGTIPILAQDGERFRAASLCIDASGEVRARYDKIHLFDVSVDDDTGSYCESRYTEPGEQVVTVDSPFGKIGMSVCYDVRFSGLFQALGNVDVIVVPSAFTQKTGDAHWHTLLRARSIEKQCYVVGANQGGKHLNGRQTYGNSVIYSPWGDTLASMEKGIGYISATIDFEEIESVRKTMPIQQHTKFRSHFDQSR